MFFVSFEYLKIQERIWLFFFYFPNIEVNNIKQNKEKFIFAKAYYICSTRLLPNQIFVNKWRKNYLKLRNIVEGDESILKYTKYGETEKNPQLY